LAEREILYPRITHWQTKHISSKQLKTPEFVTFKTIQSPPNLSIISQS
jgi:hypothetical protein